MAQMSCSRCGSALTRGARFCSKCGTTTAETADFNVFKTRPFGEEQTDQKAPSHSAVTEALPSIPRTGRISPSDYETEEIPRLKITAQAEEAAPTALTEAIVTIQSPLSNPPSSGRKWLFLAAAVGVVALGAGSIFFVNSRRTSETQTAVLPADEVKPAASAQPSGEPATEPTGEPSPAAANDQTRPQSDQPADGVKSPLIKSAEADSKSSQQVAAKPTPPPQVKNDADGTGAAVFNYNQGVTYMNTGRFQEALREFEYVKKLDPGNRNVYYLIGQTYHKMGKLDQALEAYRLCTSGQYASVALNHVKALEKRVGKND